jgi:hypothetical protein
MAFSGSGAPPRGPGAAAPDRGGRAGSPDAPRSLAAARSAGWRGRRRRSPRRRAPSVSPRRRRPAGRAGSSRVMPGHAGSLRASPTAPCPAGADGTPCGGGGSGPPRPLGKGRRLPVGALGDQCEDELLDIVIGDVVVRETALKRSRAGNCRPVFDPPATTGPYPSSVPTPGGYLPGWKGTSGAARRSCRVQRGILGCPQGP